MELLSESEAVAAREMAAGAEITAARVGRDETHFHTISPMLVNNVNFLFLILFLFLL
jgi:hypothetical protein